MAAEVPVGQDQHPGPDRAAAGDLAGQVLLGGPFPGPRAERRGGQPPGPAPGQGHQPGLREPAGAAPPGRGRPPRGDVRRGARHVQGGPVDRREQPPERHRARRGRAGQRAGQPGEQQLERRRPQPAAGAGQRAGSRHPPPARPGQRPQPPGQLAGDLPVAIAAEQAAAQHEHHHRRGGQQPPPPLPGAGPGDDVLDQHQRERGTSRQASGRIGRQRSSRNRRAVLAERMSYQELRCISPRHAAPPEPAPPAPAPP